MVYDCRDRTEALNSDATRFYQCLGVDRNASHATIRKAYQRLAIQCHPDKGGNVERFKDINLAYQTLINPHTRLRYNELGEEFVQCSMSGSQAEELFNEVLGTGNANGSGGSKKTRTVVHELSATLEELYNGVVRKILINREVIDRNYGVRECRMCGTSGKVRQQIRLGYDIQEVFSTCSSCQGLGKTWKPKKDRETIDLHIEPGAVDGQKIVLKGMADERPDHIPGDVVFVLHEKPHPMFCRKGADLYIKRNVLLSEALAGFCFEIKHLDGRRLRIKSKQGEVIQPGCWLDRSNGLEFECFEDLMAFPGEVAEKVGTSDLTRCKKLCSKRGFAGFFLWQGVAHFLSQPRESILSNQTRCEGVTLYVCPDPEAAAQLRMRKAVKGEGMPCYKNPMAKGNLFVLLRIVYPDKIGPEIASILKEILPGRREVIPPDPKYEPHFLSDIDPELYGQQDDQVQCHQQ
eukprot:gnl/MRDRNA2_/MRDRNA2_72443_c0_seq1.p1 gnl/MRDRNA2_/MRDRNA2_72443_c0~~gnl/MRDRNA2_/MRDRNA2_72443_c0_seq1.p1  ORF type:complete len:462 (+),score=55.84 gnl/MRDRNA2_/MRDRNA2_72443_c0_seq1:64-1449(+)